jgi:hypothetical protein
VAAETSYTSDCSALQELQAPQQSDGTLLCNDIALNAPAQCLHTCTAGAANALVTLVSERSSYMGVQSTSQMIVLLIMSLQALAVAQLSSMEPPTPAAAAAASAAAARADALPLLQGLRSKLAGSQEMAGKLAVLQDALQQVRRMLTMLPIKPLFHLL